MGLNIKGKRLRYAKKQLYNNDECPSQLQFVSQTIFYEAISLHKGSYVLTASTQLTRTASARMVLYMQTSYGSEVISTTEPGQRQRLSRTWNTNQCKGRNFFSIYSEFLSIRTLHTYVIIISIALALLRECVCAKGNTCSGLDNIIFKFGIKVTEVRLSILLILHHSGICYNFRDKTFCHEIQRSLRMRNHFAVLPQKFYTIIMTISQLCHCRTRSLAEQLLAIIHYWPQSTEILSGMMNAQFMHKMCTTMKQ